MNPIAESSVIITRPTGQTIDVKIRVFAPVMETGNAACDVEIAGLHDRIHRIRGETTFQALALSVQFVQNTLEAEETSKRSVVTLPGDDAVPFDWRGCWLSE
jgi:hypothetical protein